MSKPKLLDLFCGAGGAAMGYYRAGFDVTGIDISPQPHYPFQFIQADAMTYPLDGYDCYHASPPCQHYSIACARWRTIGYEYPDLIDSVRNKLLTTKKFYIIENVTGARKKLKDAFKLCGLQFGLKVCRHRWFETNFPIMWPVHENCSGAVTNKIAINDPCGHGMPGHTYRALTVADHGGNSQSFKYQDWEEAMGIDWMNKKELTQAIPPAYTEYIGKYLIKALENDTKGT
jgi:DNA (cytosine-5)-methyltransferase 1